MEAAQTGTYTSTRSDCVTAAHALPNPSSSSDRHQPSKHHSQPFEMSHSGLLPHMSLPAVDKCVTAAAPMIAAHIALLHIQLQQLMQSVWSVSSQAASFTACAAEQFNTCSINRMAAGLAGRHTTACGISTMLGGPEMHQHAQCCVHSNAASAPRQQHRIVRGSGPTMH